jgi:hypothetical protein
MTTVSKHLLMSTRESEWWWLTKERVWCLLLLGPRECSHSLSSGDPRSNWEHYVRMALSPSRVSYSLNVRFLPSLLLLYNREDGSSALSC